MAMKTQLSDAQWSMIEPLLPAPSRTRKDPQGRPTADNRACFEGILWVLRVDPEDDSTCGIGFLCIQGVCTQDVCREDWFCQVYYDGKVCKDHFCKPCDPETPCPGGYVCVAGQCVEGNCCTDANCYPIVDCGDGVVCINHYCKGCVVGSDCWPQWPCLDRSGACNPDHSCKPPQDLDVLPGYCFIENKCEAIGSFLYNPPAGQCHVCYWEADAQGKVVVGSKKEWTPGTWDPVARTFTSNWCFVDGRCIPAKER